MTEREFKKYDSLIRSYAKNNYRLLFREPGGKLKHPFIVPGSHYSQELWDWDSWLTDIAIRKITDKDITEYEQGCILNYLDLVGEDGWTPIMVKTDMVAPPFDASDVDGHQINAHKPCLAQHAAFVIEATGDASFIVDRFGDFERFLGFYFNNCFHEETGLFFWLDDTAIGVDNEPCTFYRPHKSTASIYLNCFMYKELLATAFIAEKLGFAEKADEYADRAAKLKQAIRANCWDERDGFYFSVDLNLLPIGKNFLHSGAPRHWNCLIQRIDVWTGFLAMWAGIASPEEAAAMVKNHFHNTRTFNAPYGIRSLSKLEKMYAIKVSGNPSCWLGPIWGIANYMVFCGLVDYGYMEEAKELCEKTIKLFGKDIEENGEMHEYYDPETGKGVNNKGFQSWNLLVVDMLDWYKENI